MVGRIGLIGKNYCKHTDSQGDVSYDCVGWRYFMSDEMAEELGLDKDESGFRYRPKSSLQDPKACNTAWYDHGDKCKEGEILIYHGTSQESAKSVLKNGFEMHTGYLGRGVYFSGMHDPPFAWEIDKKVAVNYANEKEEGTVLVACIPEQVIKSFHDFYYKGEYGEWEVPDWYDEFKSAQADTPESLELWFSWHGHEYDTMEQVREAWNACGEKVRTIALEHGMQAWSDQDDPAIAQTIIYDPRLLEQLDVRELVECRTN